MSVQAMTWALAMPATSLKNPAARHVLLCLANYAGTDGRGAFPSAHTLSADTGLSERTVRYKLDELEASGLIKQGNRAIAAAYIDRMDRITTVYDLQLLRGAADAPRTKRGANEGTGCSSEQNGVQLKTERGAAAAPNPPLNHQLTEEQQQREILEQIAEQDRKALEPVDDRQRFAMFADWIPEDETIAAQLTIAALPADALTDELLRGFKGFFAAKSSTVDSSGGWCFRLVTWIKRERVKSVGAVVEEEPGAAGDWASKGVVL